mgnify:CR=1 FL=1
MRGIGFLLILLGLGSFALQYLEREFLLLSWVDTWGPEIGVGIRIGAAILGLILVFMSMRRTA